MKLSPKAYALMCVLLTLFNIAVWSLWAYLVLHPSTVTAVTGRAL